MANAPLPPPITVEQLLTDALIIGQVVGFEEDIEPALLNLSFRQANRIIARWQRRRYLVYQLIDYAFVSTGAQSYTVGAGQNFNINPRPERLEFAFLRQIETSGGPNSLIDYPLSIIPSYEDYSRIVLKNLGTFSNSVFYNPGFPVGSLLPWPVPQASIYEIHIGVKQTLAPFASLQSNIILPAEYESAMQDVFAKKFRSTAGLPPDEELNGDARDGLNTIRLANVAVPTLQMPRALQRSGEWNYNYRSDTP